MSLDIKEKWIEKLEEALTQGSFLSSDATPLFFPWQEFADHFSKQIGLSSLALSNFASGKKSKQTFSEGLGQDPIVISLEVSPLNLQIHWMIASEDMQALCQATLSPTDAKEGFSDPRLQEGFYYLLSLQALHLFDHLKIAPEISIRITAQASLPEEEMLFVDVGMTLPLKTIYGRLLYPEPLLTELKKLQPAHQRLSLLPQHLADRSLPVRIEIGSTTLDEEEWRNLLPGDFLIFDHLSYNPVEKKGSGTLWLGSTPLLVGRFKPEGIKVADFSLPLSKSDEASLPNQIHLTLELDPIQIPATKLLDVEMDHLLEMPLDSLSRPVRLISQGREVATGDLLSLGDLSGIRIVTLESHG